MDNIFFEKVGCFNFSHPLDRKQNVFYGQPQQEETHFVKFLD